MRWYRYFALAMAFLIGNYNGYIALWKDSAAEPMYVSPYSAASLPLEDQQRLAEGIRVNSKEELYQLIEDYLS